MLTVVAKRAGKFIVSWDEAVGYISFQLLGFVNEEEARICYTALAELWAASRQRHGRTLLLVDAANAQVQAPALIKEMTGANPQAVCEVDRIAFVVSSSLLKMQMKREVDNDRVSSGFFLSLNAAETWLLAHEPQSVARLAS